MFGLALTTAAHGALLIQLTTVVVPILRNVIYKERIPTQIKLAILLAVAGVACFATDTSGTPTLTGDAWCVVAALCYSAYDLRLYEYGKHLDPQPLITTKIATQALLSCLLYLIVAVVTTATTPVPLPATLQDAAGTASRIVSTVVETLAEDGTTLSSSPMVMGAILWSGMAVNALAPFLQVQGQQIVGPTKCQTIYASQPLWAAILSYVVLGETLGYEGIIGGCIFITALILAAGTEPPLSPETQLVSATATSTSMTTATAITPPPSSPSFG